MGRYTSITKDEFEQALRDAYPSWRLVDIPGCQELVYGRRLDFIVTAAHSARVPVTIRVYSSIDKDTHESRGVGADAIRVCFVMRRTDGTMTGIGRTPRIYRTENWASNLKQLLNRWQTYLTYCETCGYPQTLCKGRFGPFYRCTGCGRTWAAPNYKD